MTYTIYQTHPIKEHTGEPTTPQLELLRLIQQSPCMHASGVPTFDRMHHLMRLDATEIEAITRRDFIIGAGGLALSTALVGCELVQETDVTTSATRIFKHALGQTEIPVKPERIIALSALEIMWPLHQMNVELVGADVRPGALEQLRTIDPELATWAESLPSIGGNDQLNIEAIAALDPDLIIGMSWQADSYELLTQIAPTVMLDEATDIIAWQRALADLAGATDNSVLDARIAAYEERVEALRLQYPDMWPKLEWARLANFYVTSFLVMDTSEGSAAHKVLSDLGATLTPTVSMFAGEESPQVSLEVIPEYDADVIFITAFPEPPASEMLALLETTFAGQANQIIEVKNARWTWRNVDALFLVLEDLEAALADGPWDVSGDF